MATLDAPSLDPIPLRAPFVPNSGRCWTVPVDPAAFPLTDEIGFVTRSILALREDGVLLGPGHASHDDIRVRGGGRYSHWQHTLYFSASDGSDPNTNGRTYTVEPSEAVYFAERADYAISIVGFYATHVPGGVHGFRDRLVLEIGPGPDMGTVLAMVCLGAKVCVVDRYLADWRPGWHDSFLTVLEERMRSHGWPIDPAPLQRSRDAQAFDPDRVRAARCSLEELGSELDGTIDLSVSHAAFEHLFATKKAFRALHRVMRPEAHGVHRVDFRDHRNFAQPFEFLLMSDDAYDTLSGDAKYQYGNRVRPTAMTKDFRRAGFADVAFIAESPADPAYLKSFLPRLRQAADSPFRNTTGKELSTVGGTFLLTR